jgi:DNA-binding CsgD family transcriptional regulator
VAGEAGAGKTRLLDEVIEEDRGLALRGAGLATAQPAYGPVIAALRSHLRWEPDALAGMGPLLSHVAVLLPELGEPAEKSDSGTVQEALRAALVHLAGTKHLVMVLDDLHWSDQATLEFLAAFAEHVAETRVAVIGAYRSDGLPRDHQLRRLRHELRRAGHLTELTLGSLDAAQTSQLVSELLPEPPSPALVDSIFERTGGSPFFVEELLQALTAKGSLTKSPNGLEISDDIEVPVPETVRDAILLGMSDLSDEAHGAAEAAAVAGATFDVRLLEVLGPEPAFAELWEQGLLSDDGQQRASFGHALTRDALYAGVPWLRRRKLHRQVADALTELDAPSFEVASHWRGAGEGALARAALIRAAQEAEAVHAHRDATRAGRQALDDWPEGEDDDLRIEMLDSYARSAEYSGEIDEAIRAWRELASIRSGRDGAGFAAAQQRLGGLFDRRGEREQAFGARRLAVDAFSAADLNSEAALVRMDMANHRRASGNYAEAVELAEASLADSDKAARIDLRARALGTLGVAQAKGGEFEEGLATVREGLAIAVEHDLTGVAAELYQRLSLVLYDAADYRKAEEALETALALCRTGDGVGSTEVACVTCLVYVLRERGEWSQADQLGRELIESDTAVWVAEGLLGNIQAFQGKYSSARKMLTSSRATSSQVGHFNMYVDATFGLAYVADGEGSYDEAAEHCRALLARWEESEDHHYAVSGLRWAAAFYARRGDRDGARACTDALTRIAAEGGHAEGLAALAHAIGESALMEGDEQTAAEQLTRAVELQRPLGMPFQQAHIELRAGVALAAAGNRELALERLSDAYRSARKLGARPLASEAAAEVAALGESVAQRLGSRAEADADGAGLTRRESEILRHLAAGETNREIAEQLFLSQRTVDAHVRNVLRKLGCRSRVDAARRAGELGLISS